MTVGIGRGWLLVHAGGSGDIGVFVVMFGLTFLLFTSESVEEVLFVGVLGWLK